MTHFKKLAIAGAISASLMGATAVEAHVSYNANNVKNPGAAGVWTGGAPSYTGQLQADWVANVHNNATDPYSMTVSTADFIAKGGQALATTVALAGGNGNFVLTASDKRWNPASSWGAALDFGLINLHSDADVTVKVEADGSDFTAGFTLFSGWDTGLGNKHAAWNADPSNPGTLSTSGLSYLGHASTAIAGGVATYTFTNLAAGNYSLWIGGNGTDGASKGYMAMISTVAAGTTSPVPVPGAVWLFGSAVAGMVGFGRRKASVAA